MTHTYCQREICMPLECDTRRREIIEGLGLAGLCYNQLSVLVGGYVGRGLVSVLYLVSIATP
jgi:hypothetical protein